MNKKVFKEIFSWLKSIIIALVITIGIKSVFLPTFVNGESMYPTLDDHDFLLVYKLAYSNDLPERGDIIVFKSDLIDSKTNKKKDLVKRVIALPGERITIKDNKVLINGEFLNESYLIDIDTFGDVDIIVPDDHIFVLGDNRDNSTDSRSQIIGTIPLDDILGKVVIRMFPFNKICNLDI